MDATVAVTEVHTPPPPGSTPVTQEGKKLTVPDGFRAWWDADYSWDGLGERYSHIVVENGVTRGVSLQELWATEKDHLIEFAGRLWTRFHLPMHDLSGKPSPKTSWSKEEYRAFLAEIDQRLEHGLTTYHSAPDKTHEGYELSDVDKLQCDLSGVVFPRNVSFKGRKLAMQAFDAWFAQGVSFEDAKFVADAFFTRSYFGRVARFGGIEFTREAHFSDTRFARRAIFKDGQFRAHALFLRASFEAGVDFFDAQFDDVVWFTRAKFKDESHFTGASFHKRVWFWWTDFEGRNLVFNRSVFEDYCSFAYADFGCIKASFVQAKFNYYTDFSGNVGARPFLSEMDFSAAEFHCPVTFHRRAWQGSTIFADTRFHDRVEFHDCEMRADTDFTGTHFAIPPYSPSADRLPKNDKGAPRAELRTERNIRLARHESSFRVLRRWAGDNGIADLEGKFYALELRTRELRDDIALSERLLSRFFRWTANYGQSIMQPLLALALAIVTCTTALCVYFFGFAGYAEQPTYWDILFFVGRQFVPPPSVWSDQEMSAAAPWLKAFFHDHSVWLGWAALITATWGAAMIALMLITLRRRFALR